MTHDVFISYSKDDQKIVEGLSAYLEQNGIRCFVAYRDIPSGVVWAESVTEGIENCKLMIVVFSEHFNNSKQVDREIGMCIEEGKPILTFKIQKTDFKGAKKYYLKNINWIDAFPSPEKYFGELLISITGLLSKCEIKEMNLITEDSSNKTKTTEGDFLSNDFSKANQKEKDIGIMSMLSVLIIIFSPIGISLLGTYFLAFHGEETIPYVLPIGLFGLFIGIYHSIIALQKKIENTLSISIIGAVLFPIFTFITFYAIYFYNVEYHSELNEFYILDSIQYKFLPICWIFELLFSIVYSIIWINKIKKISKRIGLNTKELQKKAYAEHKKTIIISSISFGLISFIVFFMFIKPFFYENSTIDFTNIEGRVDNSEIFYEAAVKNYNEENYKEAFVWFTKVAEQGNDIAQSWLGFMYENGKGVNENYGIAIQWYQKSAEQGNAYAQNRLGEIYYYGKGVVIDYNEAIEWYQKAAEQGEAGSQFSLGFMYENGEGVDQNYAIAKEWYEKAAKLDYSIAIKRLKYLKSIGY